MNTQVGQGHSVTCIFIMVIVLVCIAYNVFAFLYFGEGGASTISRVIYYEAKRHPVIALAIGLVVGHFLWSN